MCISHIDGRVNKATLVQRDTVINANTLIYLGRDRYSDKQKEKIRMLRQRQKAYYEVD